MGDYQYEERPDLTTKITRTRRFRKIKSPNFVIFVSFVVKLFFYDLAAATQQTAYFLKDLSHKRMTGLAIKIVE